jgi:hypothetical protein
LFTEGVQSGKKNSSPIFSTSDGKLKRCNVIEKEGNFCGTPTHVKLALPTTPYDNFIEKFTL